MEYMTSFFTTAGLLCFCLATGVSTADKAYVAPKSSQVGSNQTPSNEIKIVDENTHGWTKGDNGSSISVVKRYLRWNNNYQIQPTPGEAFTVNYFKPHKKSEIINVNEGYTGFTLYRRNGKDIEENTGIFHYVKTADAIKNRGECRSGSLHAGAYYHIYGNCPEKDNQLVVSGHCRLRGGSLGFNSLTFNSIQSYSDKPYYDPNNNKKVMNSIEISHFNACVETWKSAHYSLDYRCNLNGSFKVVDIHRAERNASTNNDNLSTCLSCEEDCNPGSSRQIISSLILVIASSIIASSI